MRISKKVYPVALFGLLGMAAFVANAAAESASPAVKAAEKTAPAAGAGANSAAQALEGVSLKGKVVETMNAGGYTYLLVDSREGKVWVAIPETTVAAGQEVVSAPGMVMRDFTSKTLNRSFAQIIFAPGLETGSAAAQPAPQTATQPATAQAGKSSFADALAAETTPGSGVAMGTNAGDEQVMGQQNSSGSAGAVVPAAKVQVDKATGSNSYTVGEIFGQAKELSGKTVRVRGQVVKNSRMIMGKNWLHLQDGTGDQAKNRHDLVVTTMADAAEGDIVTVEGVVAADRDFGAGYNYQVLVENAEVEQK
ncbi:MAG: OB-fold nucleic acid binding domain-containing protein [bacterium]|nr:OB-fold nucleic acid binding domain-containing protein [bacterium]